MDGYGVIKGKKGWILMSNFELQQQTLLYINTGMEKDI